MTLKNQLNDDLKDAMRKKEVTRRTTIRLLLAAIRNEEIAQQKELESEGILQVINKQAQQRRESIDAYKTAKRDDLVDKEQAELDIIGLYLPEPLSNTEVTQIIEKAIIDVGATGPQDMGKVMGKIIPQTRGRADGKEISAKVGGLLRKIIE
jgi:hypothetical protein